jgi:hypothetical protein
VRRQLKPNRTFRPHCFREKAPVVDADFVGHELVQQPIHMQNEILVFFGLTPLIVHLIGVEPDFGLNLAEVRYFQKI